MSQIETLLPCGVGIAPYYNVFKLILRFQFVLLLLLASLGWADSAVYLDTDRSALQARVDLLLEEGVKEVNLATYIFRRDRIGLGAVGLAHYLSQKGVKVRILLDYYETREGFYSITPEILAFLNEAGVEVRYYHEFSKWDYFNPIAWIRKINPRLHEKILTINQDKTIVGGRNVSTNYFYSARERRPPKKFNQFLDRDVYIEGESAKGAYDRFMELWHSAEVTPAKIAHGTQITQEFRDQVRTMLDYATKLHGTKDWKSNAIQIDKAIAHTDPVLKLGFFTGVTKQIIGAIESAQSSIVIHGPYVLMTRQLETALKNAQSRGVKVTLVTAASDNNDMAIVGPEFERDLPKLLKMGVQIYQINTFKNFHSKIIVIDNTKVFVGSLNFDSRSQRFNTEIMYEITDVELAKKALADTDYLKSISVHRTSTKFPEEWVRADHGNVPAGNSNRVGYHCGALLNFKAFLLRPLL